MTTILQQTLLPLLGTVKLSFVLRAAAVQTKPPEPKVCMAGFVMPQVLKGSVLGAGRVALLTSVSVEESGKVVGQENTLSFQVISNIPLMKGAVFTVSGLAGRLEACRLERRENLTVQSPIKQILPPQNILFDGLTTPVQSDLNEASLVPDGTPSASCLNNEGRLKVSIPQSFEADVKINFRFTVYNWATKLPGASPTVSASGCIAPLTLSGAVDQTCGARCPKYATMLRGSVKL